MLGELLEIEETAKGKRTNRDVRSSKDVPGNTSKEVISFAHSTFSSFIIIYR